MIRIGKEGLPPSSSKIRKLAITMALHDLKKITGVFDKLYKKERGDGGDVPDSFKKKKLIVETISWFSKLRLQVRSVFHWSVYHHAIFRKHGLHVQIKTGFLIGIGTKDFG